MFIIFSALSENWATGRPPGVAPGCFLWLVLSLHHSHCLSSAADSVLSDSAATPHFHPTPVAKGTILSLFLSFFSTKTNFLSSKKEMTEKI